MLSMVRIISGTHFNEKWKTNPLKICWSNKNKNIFILDLVKIIIYTSQYFINCNNKKK